MEEKSPGHGCIDAPCVLRSVYQLVIDCFMYFLSPFIISRITHIPFLPVSMAPSALVEASILPPLSSGPLRKPSRSGLCVRGQGQGSSLPCTASCPSEVDTSPSVDTPTRVSSRGVCCGVCVAITVFLPLNQSFQPNYCMKKCGFQYPQEKIPKIVHL